MKSFTIGELMRQSQSKGSFEFEPEEPEKDTTPSTCGVIESVSLRNFMCHDAFDIKLGPQINFIIGRNGSGKSAILTGISVGLGAKATDTNRGNSIKSLIKNGKHTAKITIVFLNEGVDAYKPDMYGPRITVERKISREGTVVSSYAIKGSDGRVKSTKKAVLDEILYRFIITVDNPLAFLSQDKAREFLSTSTGADKYRYFMQGSFISDILANYHKTMEHIEVIKSKVDDARREYEALSAQYNSARVDFARFRETTELRQKSSTLYSKVLWHNVIDVERKLHEFEREERNIQTDVKRLHQVIEELGIANASLERKKQGELASVENHRELVTKAHQALDAKKLEHDQLVGERRQAKDEVESKKAEMARIRESIKAAQQGIAEEQARIDSINGESKEALRVRVAELKASIVALEEEKQAERRVADEISSSSSGLADIEARITHHTSRAAVLQRKRDEMARSQGDKYAPWGTQMKAVIRDIEACTEWHRKPIGPLGASCKPRPEYTQWTRMLTTVLRKSLDAFVVVDGHDRAILDKILSRHQAKRTHSIVVRRFESFDYTGAKPRGQTTVDDMLDFADENVLYTMIDMNSIERMAIVTHKSEIDRVLRVPNVASTLSFLNNRSGQRSSKSGSTVRYDPVFYRDELARFAADSVSHAEQLEAIEHERTQIEAAVAELREKRRNLMATRNNQLQASTLRIRAITGRIEAAAREAHEAEAKLMANGNFARIASLQSQIDEANDHLRRLDAVMASLAEDIHAKKEGIRAAKEEWTLARTALEAAEAECQRSREAVVNIDTEMATNNASIQHAHAELARRAHVLSSVAAKIAEGNVTLKEVTKIASNVSRREELEFYDTDTTDNLREELEQVRKLHSKFENQIGTSLDDITRVVDLKLAKKRKAEKILNKLDRSQKEMDEDMKMRYQFLTTTIESNTHNASRAFENCLEVRGFGGSLLFNHDTHELRMLAHTRTDTERREMDSLSGGEKSYAQIALLLSIWKVMGSKVRGLDEFDVFMDSVNRSVSIKLLLRELRQFPKSQSIFITPQDIAVVGDLVGDDVRIHKVGDPRK